MEFLGIGYQELLLVLVLTLVFVGPERLPTVAYQIGRAVRTLQQYARQVRDEFGDEISYLEEQVRTVRGEVDLAASELRTQSNRLNAEIRDATAPLNDVAQELRKPVEPVNGAPVSTVPSEAALALGNGLAANGVSHNGSLAVAEQVQPAAEPEAPAKPGGSEPPLVF